MTIYTGPVFEMAREQFQVIADHLEIPNDERDAAAVSQACDRRLVPDPPRRRQYCGLSGYRVQHHLTLGPTKGGTRFSPQCRYRRGGGAGDLDELEMCPRRPALWRRQGRASRSIRAHCRASELENLSAPLHAGDDPLRRPAHRRHGARHGHQRAGHGLVHGHLFHVPGPDGHRDRHRQAGRLRRHRGPARSDRPWRRVPGRACAGAHRHRSRPARPRSSRVSAMSAATPRRRLPRAASS